ncbi:MAG: hypothetical protein ACHRXM_35620 [Isosphaerales bacterium]
MSPQPHEGLAAQGPSSSTLGLEDDSEGLDQLRQILGCFNHRCRNSLNGIKMGLYLFKREAEGPMHRSWIELARIYEEIERMFDRLQVIYRPLSVTMVRSPLGLLVTERLPSWRSSFSGKGRTLVINRPDPDDSGEFDPMYLGLGLDAFIGWRAEAGHPTWQSCLSWRIADGCFEVAWDEIVPSNHPLDEEHGNGIPHGPRPSVRGDSLALPLLARVVAAHGGYLETTSEPVFGMKLRWPQFRSSEPTR